MLKSINYPVADQNIVIMGQPERYKRSWVVSPLRRGNYSMLIHPKGMIDIHYSIFRIDFFSNAFHSAPARIEFTIPPFLKRVKEWNWTLVLWQDSAFDLEIGKPKPPSLSNLLYEHKAAAKGKFVNWHEEHKRNHRLIVWSCNQPFITNEHEEATLNEYTELIFEWFDNQVKLFTPDLVWGLGDTAYSDGTEGTNFIDQYYDNITKLQTEEAANQLLIDYRKMYKGHWSFPPLQAVMRTTPFVCVWDDHEIRDGWGSEQNDFDKGNTLVLKQARKVAEEFILNNGPRVRPQEDEDDYSSDAHQAYVDGGIASFIFDGRASRKYNDPNGEVISQQQLEDFEEFAEQIAKNDKVKFLLMGSAVPFINLLDFIEKLGSDSPDLLNDITGELRDDIRDSWHSPGNQAQLKKVISVLRRLHRQRPDLEFVVISGDIHVANLFAFQPLGFTKALYQVTTSALTNRQHPSDTINNLITIGTESWSDALGLVSRIWETTSDPNFLTISIAEGKLELNLKVLDLNQEVITADQMDSAKDLSYKVGTHRFAGQHRL